MSNTAENNYKTNLTLSRFHCYGSYNSFKILFQINTPKIGTNGSEVMIVSSILLCRIFLNIFKWILHPLSGSMATILDGVLLCYVIKHFLFHSRRHTQVSINYRIPIPTLLDTCLLNLVRGKGVSSTNIVFEDTLELDCLRVECHYECSIE